MKAVFSPGPSYSDPNHLIALWWADLSPALGGAIYAQTLGVMPERRFVVQYDGVAHASGDAPITSAGGLASPQPRAPLGSASSDKKLRYLTRT